MIDYIDILPTMYRFNDKKRPLKISIIFYKLLILL
nr:MAG TPA: hypothetical protein [Caudoviricetes sp.]